MRKLLYLCVFLLVPLLFFVSASAEVKINELLASNGVYTDGHAYDWVELYNDSDEFVSLSGFYLSNDPYQPKKWAFPDDASIPAHGYTLVYCIGKDNETVEGALCADFKLSKDGDTICLTDSDGKSVSLAFPQQFGNISYGLTAGSEDYHFLETATPNAENVTLAFDDRASAPVLQTSAGFYTDSVTVSIAAADGLEIHYTTDCSTPTRTSPLYTGPFDVTETAIVRAVACSDTLLTSTVSSATYFINDPSAVAVVSLYSDDTYLFDKKTGFMVKGYGSTPNYMKNLQYPCQFDYFDETGTLCYNGSGTMKVTGKTMRAGAQKSIALYARSAYDCETFDYPFFENRDYTEYSALLLRYSNSDFKNSRLRDPALQELSEGLDIYYQAGKVIVLYINGQYWGHYNLRERANRESLAQWEGITDENIIDNVDILEATGWRDEYVIYGSNEEWKELVTYCKTHDMNVQEYRDYLLSQIDVDNWFTYAAYAMVIGNFDANNTRFYRFPGGKWKFMIHDLDVGFYNTESSPVHLFLRDKTAKASSIPHWPITALLEVPEYRDMFLKRLAEVIKSNFLYDTQVQPVLQKWHDQIEPLLTRHIAKFHTFSSVKAWNSNYSALLNVARRRPRKVIDYVCQQLSIKKDEKNYYFGEVLQLLTEHNAN